MRAVTGGTDNHLLLIDVQGLGITGKDAEHVLDEVGITCNKNTIPFETQSPFITSGIRLGSPALTTRGFKEEDFKTVGRVIASVLKAPQDASVAEEARKEVATLCEKYPIYK